MGALSKALIDTAAKQHGILTLQQLADEGVGRQRLASMRDRRELITAGVKVLRIAGSPSTIEQRLWAAMLDAGNGATLSHRTAAWLHKLDGFNTPWRIELTITRVRKVQRSDVTVHRVTRLDAIDRARMGGLWCTTPARTLCDLAAGTARAALCDAVDSAQRDRRVREVAVRAAITRLRRRGAVGLPLRESVLQDRPGGGLHSVLERAFFELVKNAGLPRPTSQVVLALDRRRVIRVDLVFEDHLVCEVSGHRTHSTRRSRTEDARRQRALRLAGFDVIEFTSDEVFGEPERVQAELAAHLAFGA